MLIPTTLSSSHLHAHLGPFKPLENFPFTMISDNDLYSLAIFLGSLAMLLIVLYHFLEVNAIEDGPTQSEEKASSKSPSQAQARTPAKS